MSTLYKSGGATPASNEKRRLAGVAVPVFSLRREGDAGVGDFLSLLHLVQWTAQAGMSIVQTLPINDTSFFYDDRDSYPYNAISVFALHPLYIALDLLPAIKDVAKARALMAERVQLALEKEVPYRRAMALKEHWLKEVFCQEEEQIAQDSQFVTFCKKEQESLLPYALFKALAQYHHAPWTQQWNDPYRSTPTFDLLREWSQKPFLKREVQYHLWTQFVAHSQLTKVVQYAHSVGVSLKGDLPIGVHPAGVDVWYTPQFFNLDMQCGAPPDYFSQEGQNWGFPTYRWSALEATDYAWWKARLRFMEQYFDYLRVDHVLGYFRIWSIPRDGRLGTGGYFVPQLAYSLRELEEKGLSSSFLSLLCNGQGEGFVSQQWMVEEKGRPGYFAPRVDLLSMPEFAQLSEGDQAILRSLHQDFFYHRHASLWKREGLKHLAALSQASTIELCAEDLGMVPDVVPEVLQELGIATLHLERMPKHEGIEFESAQYFAPNSVATTSNHDMEPLRLWWNQDVARSQRYYQYVLMPSGRSVSPYSEQITPALVRDIVRHHLLAPSYLCILPLQDWLAMDPHYHSRVEPQSERINNPAHANHVWNYRMPLTVQSLLLNRSLTSLIRLEVLNSRRTSVSRSF